MWPTIIGAIISFAGTAIVFGEKTSENVKNRKPVKWANLSLLIASIGVVVTVFGALMVNQDKENERVAKVETERKYDSVHSLIVFKEDSLKTLNGQLNIATDSIKSKTEYIIHLQNGQLDTSKSILDKSLKVIALQNKAFKEITGNGNKPTIYYWGSKRPDKDTINDIVIGLQNESAYPIHGATIIVHEIYPKKQGHTFSAGTNNFEYPPIDLAPGATRILFNQARLIVPGSGYSYGIEIWWSQGFYQAEVQIRSDEFEDNGYLKSFIKYRTIDFKELPPNFFSPNRH